MSDELKWRVMCGRCGASTDWYSSRDAAIAAWNTRADDAPEQPVDNAQVDTRERLEADISAEYYMLADKELEPIFGWLDRQATITEHETVKQWDEQASELACHANKLQAQVDELTAERDELREALDACGTGTMYELWRKDHARLEAIRAAMHDKPGGGE